MIDKIEMEEIKTEEVKRKPRQVQYVFLCGCNYRPLDNKRYEVGEKDDLADWSEEHIQSALVQGIIKRGR